MNSSPVIVFATTALLGWCASSSASAPDTQGSVSQVGTKESSAKDCTAGADCDDAPVAPSRDTADPAATTVDGSPAMAECPDAEPGDDESCSAVGLRCAYGPTPEVRRLWGCHDGRWRIFGRGTSQANYTCPERSDIELQTIPSGSPAPLLRCVFADGVVCSYRRKDQSFSGAFRPSPPAFWTCERPDPPGPCSVHMSAGRPCSEEGLVCAPTFCGTRFRCVDGRWKNVPAPCPP